MKERDLKVLALAGAMTTALTGCGISDFIPGNEAEVTKYGAYIIEDIEDIPNTEEDFDPAAESEMEVYGPYVVNEDKEVDSTDEEDFDPALEEMVAYYGVEAFW